MSLADGTAWEKDHIEMKSGLAVWNCPDCKGFSSTGQTWWVENSRRNHRNECPSKPKAIGYHKREIPRGKFGEVSKIREELEELEDAIEQRNKVMVGCELSDLYGALRAVADNYNLTMHDLMKMADVTAEVFKSGHRKAR